MCKVTLPCTLDHNSLRRALDWTETSEFLPLTQSIWFPASVVARLIYHKWTCCLSSKANCMAQRWQKQSDLQMPNHTAAHLAIWKVLRQEKWAADSTLLRQTDDTRQRQLYASSQTKKKAHDSSSTFRYAMKTTAHHHCTWWAPQETS